MEICLAGDTVIGAEAGEAVGRTRDALLAEIVREVAISAIRHTLAVEHVLTLLAGGGLCPL